MTNRPTNLAEEGDQARPEEVPVRSPNRQEITDPWSAYRYASCILRARYPAGEEIIATDPDSAFNYARDVIKGAFPAGEAAIKKNQLFFKA